MPYSTKMEERFCDLETKVAYQEKEMAELNVVVFRQQRTIQALEGTLKQLTQHLKELGFPADTSKVQLPPHY